MKLVKEMLFADDNAVDTHSSEDIEKFTDIFAKAAAQFDLRSIIKKLNAYLSQWNKSTAQPNLKKSSSTKCLSLSLQTSSILAMPSPTKERQ